MIAKYLWLLGSLILVMLGLVHMYLTFFTDKFSSANTGMIEAMKSSSPRLTQDSTMWKAWVGFNGSHSAGILFIGVLNMYLVLRYFPVLQEDHGFFLINIGTIGFYMWLASRYWFAAPFIGLSIAVACMIGAYLITRIIN